MQNNSNSIQRRASAQEYVRAMAPHRTEEELAFSMGLLGASMPGVIQGDLNPLSADEAFAIQESNEAKKEGQEDQPQDSEQVAEEVTETKKKRGRPKKSTTSETPEASE